MRYLAPCLIALLLTGCPATPTASAPVVTASPHSEAEEKVALDVLSPYVVGRVFEYESRTKEPGYKETVLELLTLPDGRRAVKTRQDFSDFSVEILRVVDDAGRLVRLEHTTSGGQSAEYEPNGFVTAVPLRVGEKWDLPVRIVQLSEERKNEAAPLMNFTGGIVEKIQPVSTPLGSYPTGYKLEANFNGSPFTEWHVPGIGCVSTRGGGTDRFLVRLTEPDS